MVMDHEVGGFKGFAFAYFDTVEAATAAKDGLQGMTMAGQRVDVKYASRPRCRTLPVKDLLSLLSTPESYHVFCLCVPSPVLTGKQQAVSVVVAAAGFSCCNGGLLQRNVHGAHMDRTITRQSHFLYTPT